MSENQPPQNQSSLSQPALNQSEPNQPAPNQPAPNQTELLPDLSADTDSSTDTESVSRSLIDSEDSLEADAQSETASEEWANSASSNRENELLSLIHDLNECNDALLAQVSKLEDDLQRVEAEASAEVEKASAAVQLAQQKMSHQVSVEQASAQQVAQAAQQQVARLVGELDTAEQRLSRQVLVSENLETELSEAQARIAQLERESALIAEKHAEEVRSRVQAETNSRDLRSRLQRQQRYTLQFKAALEKSLRVGISSSGTKSVEDWRSVPFNSSASQPISQPVGISMPRSQRIMPWASASGSTAFQGIDPHLEALIRRGNQAPDSQANHRSDRPAPSPEAEARLWQDLERIMATDAVADVATVEEVLGSKPQSTYAEAVIEGTQPQILADEELITEELTEEPIVEIIENAAESEKTQASAIAAHQPPRLNWQAESRQAKSEDASHDSLSYEHGNFNSRNNFNNRALAEDLAKARQKAQFDLDATEDAKDRLPVDRLPVDRLSVDYLPVVEGSVSPIAPVAKPLRPQKKLGSFASVQLPTFPRAKPKNFNR